MFKNGRNITQCNKHSTCILGQKKELNGVKKH